MAIQIYNSLTRNKIPFEPINPPEVKMYVCGPTVYDEPHIGHARSAYIFDVIRRYLVYRGYKVKFVRNVTDVDDKIIDKARKDYPLDDLNSAVQKVSQKYLFSYHDALQSLGIIAPDVEPKATEYVSKDKPLMQEFISNLINLGAAYVSGGDVYFDITRSKDYGKLSNQSLGKMESGVRISLGENKKNPLDFALWKSAKENEPSWDSPWGKGRPGWHIECSVMSSEILGDEFDIHGGGIDLIFPHHENEIAQSEGAGKKFAKIWIHHGLLTINGQKMAKSLGNFVTVKDFMEKYQNADLLKLLFLSTHYSHPVDYSDEKIQEAKQAFERIVILLQKIDVQDREYRAEGAVKEIDAIKDKFIEAMDDDFNTPQGLAAIFELVTLANKHLDDHNFVGNVLGALEESLDIFGLSPQAVTDSAVLEENINLKIQERNKARRDKNYALSDKIRIELEVEGIILEDTKDGKTTWRRKL